MSVCIIQHLIQCFDIENYVKSDRHKKGAEAASSVRILPTYLSF